MHPQQLKGQPTADSAAALRPAIGLLGIVTLGAGTAIGVSIFSILAPGARLAGPAVLFAMLAAMLPMFLFAVSYAFMGSAVPVSGASYEWSRRFVHPFVGFIIAWLRIAGSTSALVLYAFVLVQYWSMVVPLPVRPAMFAILALFWILNTAGVSLVARSQTLMVFVLLATCLALAASAVPKATAENFTPFFSHGWSGVLAAIPLMVSLFLGIETATEVGEEVRDGRRTIPLGIALSIAVTAAVYLVVAVAALGVLGGDALGDSKAPLLDVADASMGRYGQPLILVSATVAIGTSLNAISLIFSRYLFAMGRSEALPAAFARIHPRWGTPYVATTAVFVLCTLGLLLPSNLVFLFLAVNVPTMMKYGATCLAASRVVAHHPDVFERAAFKLKAMLTWTWAGVIGALIMLLLGLTADWRPYAVLAGWCAVGVIYHLVRRWRGAASARVHVT